MNLSKDDINNIAYCKPGFEIDSILETLKEKMDFYQKNLSKTLYYVIFIL